MLTIVFPNIWYPAWCLGCVPSEYCCKYNVPGCLNTRLQYDLQHILINVPSVNPSLGVITNASARNFFIVVLTIDSPMLYHAVSYRTHGAY